MNIVVAVYENWGIGYKGTQPVVVPEDRKHFRAVTGKGTVILGRRTLADFPGGRPLKNRRNIILTRNEDFSVDGGQVVHSIEEALEAVKDEDDDNVFVIGGDSVYRQLLPYCKRAFITKIYATPTVDAYFPDLDKLENWSIEDSGQELEHEGLKYRFITYVNSAVKKA